MTTTLKPGDWVEHPNLGLCRVATDKLDAVYVYDDDGYAELFFVNPGDLKLTTEKIELDRKPWSNVTGGIYHDYWLQGVA